MPRLSFITPAALLLLLLLPLLWALAVVARRRVAPWRFWGSLTLRSMMFVACVLALAGAQLIRPVDTLTTVFLVDASDSVAPAQRARAVDYVGEALQTMPPGNQAAVVVFGENALVERAPSDATTLGRLASVPLAARTNIQDAVQLGLALLPADSQKRLVLLSDGGENSGSALEAAQLAAVRGVPLDVVELLGERGPDVVVTALEAPATAREGQQIAAGVVVTAPFDTQGRLQVFVDGQLVSDQDVPIVAGTNVIPVQVPAGEAGFRRLEARLDAPNDTVAQNNRAATFTDVQGPPRLLLIASDATRAQNLQEALVAVGVRVDVRRPEQVPANLAQLGDYAAIAIVDTPARLLPRPLMDALSLYVRDLGRGLAMIGGVDSFGAGGYRRTPVEDVLPVSLDPLDTSRQPDLALVMVIDRSGSMSDSGGAGGRTKLDLAKESVYQASLGLSERDQLGLVVFDDIANTVLPLQPLPSAVEIEQVLSSFGPGGGTDIRPGIVQAAQALAGADARIKHVILLTDGNAPSNYSDLISQMRDQGITISTVAVGRDADPNLRQIAEAGGGRWYGVAQIGDIPRIFLRETVIVAGRDIIEEPFTPQIALQTAALRNLGGLPTLNGYNGTELKQTARALLVTPDGKPVLAQWQYGLGRAVAWTSDLQGKWAANWVQWEQFPRFISGLVDLLLPLQVGERLSVEATSSGAQTVLELTAQDEDGRPLNDLALEGRLVAPDNESRAVSFTQIDAGRYRAVASTSTPGVYLVQVAGSADGVPIGTARTGVVVSYSPEYGPNRENPQLLRDLAALTNGRVNAAPTEAFAPTAQVVGSVQEVALPLLWLALLLWPFDIAVRRLFVRPGELFERLPVRRRRAAPASASPAMVARLSAAKQRARRGADAPAELENGQPAVPPVARPADHAVAMEEQVPSPEAAPARASPPAASPPAATDANEERMARLLAAKRRARQQRGE